MPRRQRLSSDSLPLCNVGAALGPVSPCELWNQSADIPGCRSTWDYEEGSSQGPGGRAPKGSDHWSSDALTSVVGPTPSPGLQEQVRITRRGLDTRLRACGVLLWTGRCTSEDTPADADLGVPPTFFSLHPASSGKRTISVLQMRSRRTDLQNGFSQPCERQMTKPAG